MSYGDASGRVLQSLGRITRPHERAPRSTGNELLTIELLSQHVSGDQGPAGQLLRGAHADELARSHRFRQRVAKALGLASHPFAQLKPHPHPGHGIATQNSYALAAFSRWLNTKDDTALGEAAVGLTASATYWLPAGQTASFAESEPLTEFDRAEMVLPFPTCSSRSRSPCCSSPRRRPLLRRSTGGRACRRSRTTRSGRTSRWAT